MQLIQQVRQALLFGILKSGDKLPTVKEVAAQVALNPYVTRPVPLDYYQTAHATRPSSSEMPSAGRL